MAIPIYSPPDFKSLVGINVGNPVNSADMANKRLADFDDQIIQHTTVSTTSAIYVDITGLSRTAKSFGENGRYMASAMLILATNSLVDVACRVRLVYNGSGDSDMDFTIPGGLTGNFCVPVIGTTTLTGANIIKVQWLTASGTLSLTYGRLHIRGDRSTRLLP